MHVVNNVLYNKFIIYIDKTERKKIIYFRKLGNADSKKQKIKKKKEKILTTT